MSTRLLLLVAVLVAFGALTGLALNDVGYVGIFTGQLDDWGEIQVLTDLVILAGLACLWMIADARKRGLTPWPFILVTLFAGSFGPLLYLAVREARVGSRNTVLDRATS